MTRRTLLTGTLLAGVLCAGAGRAAEIRVRLVYARNQKPASGQKIVLYLGQPSRAYTPQMNGTTDSNGVAVFRLPTALPKAVWVYEENGHITGCATGRLIPLAGVMSHGVVLGVDDSEPYGRACKGNRQAIKRARSEPGEIIDYVRKLGFFEKMQE